MKSFKGLKEKGRRKRVQDLRRKNNFRASLLGEVKETFYVVFQDELIMSMLDNLFKVMHIVQAHGFYETCLRPDTTNFAWSISLTSYRNVSSSTIRFFSSLISAQTKQVDWVLLYQKHRCKSIFEAIP